MFTAGGCEDLEEGVQVVGTRRHFDEVVVNLGLGVEPGARGEAFDGGGANGVVDRDWRMGRVDVEDGVEKSGVDIDGFKSYVAAQGGDVLYFGVRRIVHFAP